MSLRVFVCSIVPVRAASPVFLLTRAVLMAYCASPILNQQPDHLVFLGPPILSDKDDETSSSDRAAAADGETDMPVQQELLILPLAALAAGCNNGGGAVGIKPFGAIKREWLQKQAKHSSSKTVAISAFESHRTSGMVCFVLNNSICVCRPGLVGPVDVIKVKAKRTGYRSRLQFSPGRSDVISFVRDGDIWITEIATSREHRITTVRPVEDLPAQMPTAAAVDRAVREARSAGVPTSIMQEEFGRDVGYWWQPSAGDSTHHSLLYEKVDESDVALVDVRDFSAGGGGSASSAGKYRIPPAGSTNAGVELWIASIEFNDDAAEEDDDDDAEEEAYDEGAREDDAARRAQHCKPKTSGAAGNSRCRVHHFRLPVPLRVIFPWCEYIVRCGWTPSGNHVWAQLLDREQARLALVMIPLECFAESLVGGDSGPTRPFTPLYCDDEVAEEASMLKEQITVLIEEVSSVWINVHDILEFLPPSMGSAGGSSGKPAVSFLWASERSGFRHLEVVTHHMEENTSTRTAVTSGEWQVDNTQVCVDEETGSIYFSGTKETPLESHLYRVDMLAENDAAAAAAAAFRWGDPVLLTTQGQTHAVAIDLATRLVIDLQSSHSEPVRGLILPLQRSTAVHRHYHQNVRHVPNSQHPVDPASTFKAAAPTLLSPPMLFFRQALNSSNYTSPTPFSFTSTRISDGSKPHTVHGEIFLPPGYSHHRRSGYPTILSVYGGPHVQLISNEYRALRNSRCSFYAKMGFIVVQMDCRGSARRGVAFEGHLKHAVGTFEVEDQIEGLRYLQSPATSGGNDPRFNIDPARVAIFGWSYGGFLALMGLVQRPDVFKVAISGAPVCKWEWYDTAYTERCMGLPSKYRAAYAKGSVLNKAAQFPDTPNRLLLVHGMIDHNVHFQHMAALVEALIQAGKPHQLHVYPTERHGVHEQAALAHYEATLLWFLLHNL